MARRSSLGAPALSAAAKDAIMACTRRLYSALTLLGGLEGCHDALDAGHQVVLGSLGHGRGNGCDELALALALHRTAQHLLDHLHNCGAVSALH